jgi:hypothetical protein
MRNQHDLKDGTHVDEGHVPPPHLLPAEMAALSMYSAYIMVQHRVKQTHLIASDHPSAEAISEKIESTNRLCHP